MFRVPFICIDELDANSDDANTNKLGDLVLEMLKTVPVVAVSHDSNLVAKMLQDSQSVSILKMEANRSNV
jgi:chromosome segregation ATPase